MSADLVNLRKQLDSCLCTLQKLELRGNVTKEEFEPLHKSAIALKEVIFKLSSPRPEGDRVFKVRKIVERQRVEFFISKEERSLRDDVGKLNSGLTTLFRDKKLTFSLPASELSNKLKALNEDLSSLEKQDSVTVDEYNAIKTKLNTYADRILAMHSTTRTEERPKAIKRFLNGADETHYVSKEESDLRKYLTETASRLRNLIQSGSKLVVSSKHNQYIASILNAFPLSYFSLIAKNFKINASTEFLDVRNLQLFVSSFNTGLPALNKVITDLANAKRVRISFNKLFEQCVVEACNEILNTEFTAYCKEYQTFKTKAFLMINVRA